MVATRFIAGKSKRYVLILRRWLLFLGIFSLLLAACGSDPYQFNGTQYPDLKPAPDFELADTQGQRFRLSEHQGQLVLVFFGYTSCPDVCPTTLAEARRVLQDLGDDAHRVTFLFITVDPDRDTPQVLANYVAAFHPDIIGLTGTPHELAAARQGYGVLAEKEAADMDHGAHIVNHTARLFLVDSEGLLRLSYAYGTPPADILQDVQYFLKDFRKEIS